MLRIQIAVHTALVLLVFIVSKTRNTMRGSTYYVGTILMKTTHYKHRSMGVLVVVCLGKQYAPRMYCRYYLDGGAWFFERTWFFEMISSSRKVFHFVSSYQGTHALVASSYQSLLVLMCISNKSTSSRESQLRDESAVSTLLTLLV